MVVLTEKQFLKDSASYARIKQHEQDTTLMHNKNEVTKSWARGNMVAWKDFEDMLNKRLHTIEEEEVNGNSSCIYR